MLSTSFKALVYRRYFERLRDMNLCDEHSDWSWPEGEKAKEGLKSFQDLRFSEVARLSKKAQQLSIDRYAASEAQVVSPIQRWAIRRWTLLWDALNSGYRAKRTVNDDSS